MAHNMNSFKNTAVRVLGEAGRALHTKEITRVALRKGWVKTVGKTPAATMGAVIAVDVARNKAKSFFKKTAPSTFALRKGVTVPTVSRQTAGRLAMGEEDVKRAVIRYISERGWGFLKFGGLRDHGVDIAAKHHAYNRYLRIEAKGTSAKRSSAENAWVYALGQIVTRMTDGGTTQNHYGIALPETSARIAARRIPWQVAKKLSLTIYSVDSDLAVEEIGWREMRKANGGSH